METVGADVGINWSKTAQYLRTIRPPIRLSGSVLVGLRSYGGSCECFYLLLADYLEVTVVKGVYSRLGMTALSIYFNFLKILQVLEIHHYSTS